MNRNCTGTHALVFFCLAGWICVGPAIGADNSQSADEADQAENTAAEMFGEAFNEPDSESEAALDAEPPSDISGDPGDGGPNLSGEQADEPVTESDFDPGSDLFADEPTDVPASDVVDITPIDETDAAFGRIDLAIEDQNVLKVLQMLAIQSKRNILPSPNVSGNLSAALYNVDFYEALDAILHTNGYGYVEDGNFIRVYTVDELSEIAAANRKVAIQVVRLNYLNGADASKFIETLLTPDVGSITVSEKNVASFEPTLFEGGQNNFALVDTMVIRDYPEVIEEMLSVIKKLDVRPRQLQIEATILQARVNEDNAYGIDLTVLVDFDMEDLVNPMNSIADLVAGNLTHGGHGLQTTVGNVTTGTSGVRIGMLTSDVATFIRALDAVTDTTVLARPKILTLNRMAAKLIAGEKLGYISTIATETATIQTVEFLEVGTQLTVRPFISGENFIRLELKPEISEGEVRSVEGFVIPDETTNELMVNVLVPNGKTIVLGGLFKEDNTITRREVPGLVNLPFIGKPLFRSQEDVVRRSEVIFLIRPTILRDENLIDIGDTVNSHIKHLRIGSREGLLPWSRTLLTAGHLRDAHQFLSEGKKDKALWSIHLAIALDPTTTEAFRIREELNGYHPDTADDGILHEAIERYICKHVDSGSTRTPPASPVPPTLTEPAHNEPLAEPKVTIAEVSHTPQVDP